MKNRKYEKLTTDAFGSDALKSVFIFVFGLSVGCFFFYASSKNDNKGLGFGRANDIVTCYQNVSYSLNWSAEDRGNSRQPAVTCRKEIPITLPTSPWSADNLSRSVADHQNLM